MVIKLGRSNSPDAVFPLGVGETAVSVTVPDHLMGMEGKPADCLVLATYFRKFASNDPIGNAMALTSVSHGNKEVSVKKSAQKVLRDAVKAEELGRYTDSNFHLFADPFRGSSVRFDLVLDLSNLFLAEKIKQVADTKKTQLLYLFGLNADGEITNSRPGPTTIFFNAARCTPTEHEDEVDLELVMPVFLFERRKGVSEVREPRIEKYHFEFSIRIGTQLRELDNKITALDFGNNATNLMTISRSDVPPCVESVHDGPVQSSVYMKRVFDQLEMGESYVGENRPNLLVDVRTGVVDARDEGTWSRTVQNPKRLIALGSPNSFPIDDPPIPVSSLLPAEIRVSEMFRLLNEKERRCCGNLVVTYPTTFLKKEINLLRRAVVRGMNRAVSNRLLDSTDVERLTQRVRFLMIDEASASAFFFFYQSLSSLGNPEFRFNYYGSKCTNLIIDVGGGTTDVVFVRCEMAPASDRSETSVRIEPLHRTGLREFGGDDITAAIFKVVKCVIAKYVQNHRSDENWLPVDRFPEWYAGEGGRENEVDRLVGTKFQRDSAQFNRSFRRTCLLFQMSEKLKIHLEELRTRFVQNGKVVKCEGGDACECPLCFFEMRELFDQLSINDKEQEKCGYEILDMLTEHIRFVYQLIEPKLEKCIERINQIIRYKLELKGIFVDHVYLVGNASKFRHIEKYIREHIRFFDFGLDDDCAQGAIQGGFPDYVPDGDLEFVHDSNNLKDVVVKGAAYAKLMEERASRLKLDQSIDLSDRMPVQFYWKEDQERPTRTNVIRFGESIKELNGRWRKVTDIAPRTNQYTFVINREFEGESESNVDNKGFLTFEFPYIGDEGEAAANLPIHMRYVYNENNLEEDDYFEMTWDPRIRAETNNDADPDTVASGVYQKNAAVLPPMLRGDL